MVEPLDRRLVGEIASHGERHLLVPAQPEPCGLRFVQAWHVAERARFDQGADHCGSSAPAPPVTTTWRPWKSMRPDPSRYHRRSVGGGKTAAWLYMLRRGEKISG